MTPFPDESLYEPTPEQLDATPLNFGKWRGKTPEEISQLPNKRDREYVVWAYENVERRDRPVFCSEVLYRDSGGRFKSAKEQRLEKEAGKSKALPLDQTGSDVREEYKAPGGFITPARPVAKGYFDDMDDDIPF